MSIVPDGNLLILSDAVAFVWVVEHGCMAFPPTRLTQGARLLENQPILIYTTQRCFGRLSKFPGGVVASGRVVRSITRFKAPTRIGRGEYTHGVKLRIDELAPLGQGVRLQPLLDRLHVFPIKHA